MAELLDGLREPLRALAKHVVVGPFEEQHRVVGVGTIEVLPGAVDHRHMVEGHRVLGVGEGAPLLQFGVAAQVDHRAQAQFADDFQVGSGQAIEPIGSEEGAPASGAAVVGGVATHVAKVVHRVEHDEPARVGAHVWECMQGHRPVNVPTSPGLGCRRQLNRV